MMPIYTHRCQYTHTHTHTHEQSSRNVAIVTYFPVLSVEGVPESIKLTLCMKSCDTESSRRIICAVSKRMDMYKTHYILPYIKDTREMIFIRGV